VRQHLPTTKSSMKTCVFTPTHETGILVAHIIPYAGSHDTRLGRESAWPLVPSGTHFFSGRCGSRDFFAPGPVERRFCFVGIRGNVSQTTHRVALQLTVVSAPPRYEAFQRMRGTPTLLGECPVRRWYMKRQQFLDGPAVVRDTSGHRRCCPATGVGQTRLRCAEIIDRTDERHAMLQRQCAARQRTPSACQRCQPLTKRRVQPLDVRGIDHAFPLRPTSERLDACRRTIDKAACGLDHPPPLVALDDLGDQNMTPRTQSGPSALPRGHGSAKGFPNGPDV
jgi:hypothetical protein